MEGFEAETKIRKMLFTELTSDVCSLPSFDIGMLTFALGILWPVALVLGRAPV